MLSLTFARMREMNGRRVERWHGPGWREPEDPWTIADWSNAVAGEAGEAANVVKKMRRVEAGLWEMQKYPGDNPPSGSLAEMSGENAYAALREKLGSELADVVLYADLLAEKVGLNLADCIRTKFNRVSETQGFPERL